MSLKLPMLKLVERCSSKCCLFRNFHFLKKLFGFSQTWTLFRIKLNSYNQSWAECLTRILRITQRFQHLSCDSAKADDKHTNLPPFQFVIVNVTLGSLYKSIMDIRILFLDLTYIFLLFQIRTASPRRINSKAIWKRERGGKCEFKA